MLPERLRGQGRPERAGVGIAAPGPLTSSLKSQHHRRLTGPMHQVDLELPGAAWRMAYRRNVHRLQASQRAVKRSKASSARQAEVSAPVRRLPERGLGVDAQLPAAVVDQKEFQLGQTTASRPASCSVRRRGPAPMDRLIGGHRGETSTRQQAGRRLKLKYGHEAAFGVGKSRPVCRSPDSKDQRLLTSLPQMFHVQDRKGGIWSSFMFIGKACRDACRAARCEIGCGHADRLDIGMFPQPVHRSIRAKFGAI